MKSIWLMVLTVVLAVISSSPATAAGKDIGIGFKVNGQKLYGDVRNGPLKFGGTPVNVRYNFRPSAFVETDFAYSQLHASVPGGPLQSDLFNIGAKLGLRFLSHKRANPLLYLGLGTFSFKTANGPRFWDGYVALGGGAELFVTPRVGLNLTGDYRLTTGDDFDGSRTGTGRDNFVQVSFGVNYYFGNRRNLAYPTERRWGSGLYLGDEGLVEVEAGPESIDDPAGTASEQYALVSFKKNQLIDSITEREREIRLLELKVNRLSKQAANLTYKSEMNSGQADGHMRDEIDPELVYYRNALVLFREGHYDDAISSLKTLINNSPSHWLVPSWWHWLGESFYDKGDFRQAVASFQKASALRNGMMNAELSDLMVALSYEQSGNQQEATAELEQILSGEVETDMRAIVEDYLLAVRKNNSR